MSLAPLLLLLVPPWPLLLRLWLHCGMPPEVPPKNALLAPPLVRLRRLQCGMMPELPPKDEQ